jgi:hypothetical protein
MSRTVVLDEIHLTLTIPTDLKPRTVRAINRVLEAPDFLARVRSAIRAALAVSPILAALKVHLSR